MLLGTYLDEELQSNFFTWNIFEPVLNSDCCVMWKFANLSVNLEGSYSKEPPF